MDPLLPIGIRPGGRGSLLRSLHRRLRAAIVEGRLAAGLRLPSTRALARQCGVSRNTAVAAYDRLLGEGLVVTHRGSGTRVASSRRDLAGSRAASVRHRRLQAADRGNPGALPAAPLSFHLGMPDAAAFPADTWRRLSARVFRRVPAPAAVPADPQGTAEFRAAIARHVSFARGVACSAGDIVVTAGAQQAFDLLARVLAGGRQALVAVEDPGYPPLRAAFEAAGARLCAIPVDAEGMVVARIPARARVICTTPSHQFPLGCAMSGARRAQLLALARHRAAIVIEDDYDGEFSFADQPLDALQTLDRAQSVFYVGTFSKSLLPSLRLGYIVAPAWARPALVAAKRIADGSCNGPMQDIAAAFIADGHLVRHVRRMRRIYARRRQLLVDGINDRLAPWLQLLPGSAGLHVAATLASRRTDAQVAARALQEGVGVTALSRYALRQPAMQGLVLGFGATPDAGIPAGIERLRRALQW